MLTNDLISRQDLMPWFACLFVTEQQRNKGIDGSLLGHGLNEAKKKGFKKLYLYTDLDNFYEQKGWKHICSGYNVAKGLSGANDKLEMALNKCLIDCIKKYH